MSEPAISTGLRLPESLNERVRAVAQRTGVPRNTLIKIILAEHLVDEIARHPLHPDTQAVIAAATRDLRAQAHSREARP
jgi:predicted DNA-binding protein